MKKVCEQDTTITDMLISGKINIVINTVLGKQAKEDSYAIRRNALLRNVPYFTTMSGAKAAAQGINSLINKTYSVKSLDTYYT